MEGELDFLPADKRESFLQDDGITLGKITSLLFLCSILKKKWVMYLIFCIQIIIKACYKLIPWFWWGWSSFPKFPKIASLQYLYDVSKRNLEMKLIFGMLINIKVFYKLISALWASKFPARWYYHRHYHCQGTQSNKFAISFQYLTKEIRNRVYFFHADNHESSCKLALSFLMEVASHVQSAENRNLVIFLQYKNNRMTII